jgi:hypothetical protein
MKFRDLWRAAWEGRTLHVSGMTDLFPNDFSTASLLREDTREDRSVVTYKLVFNRDKEPFCDKDGVGPVHCYENAFPAGARRIRVVLPGDAEVIEIDVPPRSL